MRRQVVALMLLAWPVLPAMAQSVEMPEPGTAVRVTPPPPARRPVIGTVLAVLGDSILMQAPGKADTLRLPLALDRIEVQRGVRRRTGELAAKGALAGLVAGAFSGMFSETPRWVPLLQPAARASAGGPGLALGVRVAW
jgi:hypothetical protein